MSNCLDYFGCVVNTTKNDVDLIMSPLQHIHFSSFQGVVFSTKETDNCNLISSASKIYVRQSAEYEAETQTFHFKSGARISFRAVICNEDVLRYGGMFIDYLGIYEFDCFSEMQLRYLLSRVRSHFMEPYTLAFHKDAKFFQPKTITVDGIVYTEDTDFVVDSKNGAFHIPPNSEVS